MPNTVLKSREVFPSAAQRDQEPAHVHSALALTVLVTLLWRVPSLVDPPWVNDEGTYFAVAQAMSHGYHLYQDVWENKPPALYLIYMAVYHLTGPSLVAIRLLSALAACGLVMLTFLIARRFAGACVALAAAMLCGLLLDIPFLEGTTGNAEVFMSVATALAVYLALVLGRPRGAGVAAACAVFVKVVAAFDALALVLYLLRSRRSLVMFLVAAAGASAVAGIFAGLSGILAPMLRDAFLYDLGYVGHANGGGVPWLILVKGALLASATWYARRAPFPCIWFIYALAGAVLSGRVFGHYLIQCVVPLCVCLAILCRGRTREASRALVILPSGYVALAAVSSLLGWSLANTGHDSILSRRLQWYTNFSRYAAGRESYAAYRNQVDDHVSRNIAVAKVVHTLPAGRLLVWGNTPWVYVLAGRLPATPYTSALRSPEVPGETAALRQAIIERRAGVVVIVRPAQPSLGPAAGVLQRQYRLRGAVQNAQIYVRAASGF